MAFHVNVYTPSSVLASCVSKKKNVMSELHFIAKGRHKHSLACSRRYDHVQEGSLKKKGQFGPNHAWANVHLIFFFFSVEFLFRFPFNVKRDCSVFLKGSFLSCLILFYYLSVRYLLGLQNVYFNDIGGLDGQEKVCYAAKLEKKKD